MLTCTNGEKWHWNFNVVDKMEKSFVIYYLYSNMTRLLLNELTNCNVMAPNHTFFLSNLHFIGLLREALSIFMKFR